LVRAVPGKKVFGVEWNLKMGVPPTQFYLFFSWYSPYGYSRNPPPTHPILIDIRSTPMPFFMEQPLNETKL